MDDTRPGEIDQTPLEGIVDVAKANAPMLTSLISQVGPLIKSLNSASHHLGDMRLVVILVIFCRSAHRNNINYLPLLIALYLYKYVAAKAGECSVDPNAGNKSKTCWNLG